MEDPNEKKNKPSSSAFKQQKLPAWQPILTAGTVLPTFFIIGIAFIPIGFGLLMSSSKVQERQLDYTNCISTDSNDSPAKTCAEILTLNKGAKCTCVENFTLENDYDRDVFIYYGLSNFYQNHRRYVKSRDDKQLLGVKESLTTDCAPYAYKDPEKKMPFAPCGAIANSLFNDSYTLKRLDKERKKFSIIKLVNNGIAWATDKNAKFKNPPGANLEEAFKGYSHPPNWQRNVWELDNNKSSFENNGYQNDALIVWMRTAALPTFRKLFARVDHRGEDAYHNSLPKGEYQVEITYNYPVQEFKGTKRFIISNTSWLGGKNPFLGVVYVIVGFASLILSGVFLFIHRKFGKSTIDLINVNQRTPYMS